MHPLERLRSVARATGVGPETLVREAAGALAALGDDPVGLVTSCRRLVERHGAAGPLWWLSSRVLCAAEPAAEAWRALAEFEDDATPAVLTSVLPDGATAVVLGWPEQVIDGVCRRGDVDLLLVSGGGESTGLSRHLRAAGMGVDDVEDAGTAAAVAAGDLVVVEATALGPDGFVAVAGSRAAAAVARTAGVPVWVVAGVGRALPAPLWSALVALDACDLVVGPGGTRTPAEPDPRTGCPVAAELLKPVRQGGAM